MTLLNIIDNKMKKNSMKIPPLSKLYEQKNDFIAHRKKLQEIMSERKNNLNRQMENRTFESIVKRNLNHYSQKFNTKSLQIARQNSKIMRKIQQIKPYVFRQSVEIQHDTKSNNITYPRFKSIEQQRQNYRLRERVLSMNSSLNSKKMVDDYRRSIQIKKRITHFKTEQNKVVLKAQRYFSNTSNSKKCNNKKNQELFMKIMDSPEALPTIDPGSGRMLIDRKLQDKNQASYYKRQDIIKHKVKGNTNMFKFARQKRMKTILIQQRTALNNLNTNKLISPKEAKISLFFPTQPK